MLVVQNWVVQKLWHNAHPLQKQLFSKWSEEKLSLCSLMAVYYILAAHLLQSLR